MNILTVRFFSFMAFCHYYIHLPFIAFEESTENISPSGEKGILDFHAGFRVKIIFYELKYFCEY